MKWEEFHRLQGEEPGEDMPREGEAQAPEGEGDPERDGGQPPPDIPAGDEEVHPMVPGWDGTACDEGPVEVVKDADDPEGSPRLFSQGKGPRKVTRRGRALQKADQPRRKVFTPEQKLLILDVWKRSGLSGTDFAPLVGLVTHTLYGWRKKFEAEGPEGLFGRGPGSPKGSRVDSATRRSILIIKENEPEYGCERISHLLYRGPGLGVSPGTVLRVLKEEGYEPVSVPTKPHPDKKRRFERASPNALWQTDLFTFILKRQGHRVHVVAFLDDNSRFIAGFGLASSPSTAFVLEVVRSAIGMFGAPEEILTDQGAQYHTWRGKSAFTKEMEKRGIRQIVARARRPQTLGKIERWWGTLWRECVETAVFMDMADARRRIAFFVDHYNFQRPHSSLDGLVPADRFFGAESEVKETLEKRVAANALEIARHGMPRKSFYLTGRVGDVGLSVHAEGEKVVLTTEDGLREEVDLRAPGKRADAASKEGPNPIPVTAQGVPPHEMEDGEKELGPGESPLDMGLKDLEAGGIAVNRMEEVADDQE